MILIIILMTSIMIILNNCRINVVYLPALLMVIGQLIWMLLILFVLDWLVFNTGLFSFFIFHFVFFFFCLFPITFYVLINILLLWKKNLNLCKFFLLETSKKQNLSFYNVVESCHNHRDSLMMMIMMIMMIIMTIIRFISWYFFSGCHFLHNKNIYLYKLEIVCMCVCVFFFVVVVIMVQSLQFVYE